MSAPSDPARGAARGPPGRRGARNSRVVSAAPPVAGPGLASGGRSASRGRPPLSGRTQAGKRGSRGLVESLLPGGRRAHPSAAWRGCGTPAGAAALSAADSEAGATGLCHRGRTTRSLPGQPGGSVSVVTGPVCGPRPVGWRAVLLSGREDRATDPRARERFRGCPGLRARQGKAGRRQIPERSPRPHGLGPGAFEDLSPGPFQGGVGPGWRGRESPASPRRSQPL